MSLRFLIGNDSGKSFDDGFSGRNASQGLRPRTPNTKCKYMKCNESLRDAGVVLPVRKTPRPISTVLLCEVFSHRDAVSLARNER